jgi:outer membrane protein OmpA-like peptidoglycan-associated protein
MFAPTPLPVITPKAALVLAAAVLWALASTYWYDCRIKRVCASDEVPAQAKRGAASPAAGDAALAFNFADARVRVGPAFAALKAKVLAALDDDEVLVVVGQYTAAEQSAAGNPVPDLGIQRATQTLALFADVLPPARLSAESRKEQDATHVVSRTRPFASVTFEAGALPESRLVPAPILFPVGKAKRHQTAGTREYLQAVAARIQAGKRATIEGFADPRGVGTNNLELARDRAASVRDELVKYGARIDRIELQVDSQPRQVGDNSTILGRQQNRRVEITLR